MCMSMHYWMSENLSYRTSIVLADIQVLFDFMNKSLLWLALLPKAAKFIIKMSIALWDFSDAKYNIRKEN